MEHVDRRTALRWGAAAMAGGLVTFAAACSSDPNSVADQARSGDRKGYVAGDGSIEQVPVAERGEPVRLSGTTLEGKPWDIAERAGVARDTVHAAFGNKAALIPAMVDLRLVPDEAVANVAEGPEAQAVRNETDPARQLELFAEFITKLNVVLRPVFDVMRSAAASEPTSRTKR